MGYTWTLLKKSIKKFTVSEYKLFLFKSLEWLLSPNMTVAVEGELFMPAASLGRQNGNILYVEFNLHNIQYKSCKYLEYIVKNEIEILSTIYHISHTLIQV